MHVLVLYAVLTERVACAAQLPTVLARVGRVVDVASLHVLQHVTLLGTLVVTIAA